MQYFLAQLSLEVNAFHHDQTDLVQQLLRGHTTKSSFQKVALDNMLMKRITNLVTFARLLEYVGRFRMAVIILILFTYFSYFSLTKLFQIDHWDSD